MVSNAISLGCGVRASLILLSPAGRAGDYKTHSVRVFVCYCVSRFYKGLYITLVVSPWPFQRFL